MAPTVQPVAPANAKQISVTSDHRNVPGRSEGLGNHDDSQGHQCGERDKSCHGQISVQRIQLSGLHAHPIR